MSRDDALELHERVRRQLHLAERVVQELELGSDLHQRRPVGAGARAHGRADWRAPSPISCIDQSPSSSTAPVCAPDGKTKKRIASSSVCSGWPARVEQREPQVEAPVGERQPVEPEAQLALARARRSSRAPPSPARRSPSTSPPSSRSSSETRGGATPGSAATTQPHRRRLARGELRALVAVVVEQLGRDDARLAASPLAQAGLELVRVRVLGEQPPVGGDRLAGRAVERDLALPQQHRAVAEPLDRLRVVRDEEDRAAAVLELGDLAEALALELLVADGEHLVEQQHVGLDVRGDREAEPHVHPRRVRAHRQVDELLELGERDDLVHHLAHARPREAVDRAVQVDVLAAGEVGVEAGAELEQRRDAARRPRCGPTSA